MELNDYAFNQDARAWSHYRVNHRCAIVASQAANSRLFELRNGGTNLIMLLRLGITWLQTANHTAAIEDSLDAFKCTGLTAVDTVGTVTPVASIKRRLMAAPGGAEIRGVTVAGAAAGMTGGTLAKDSSSFAQLPQWLLAAQPTAGTVIPMRLEVCLDPRSFHPFVFEQNEGFIVENRVALGAAAGSSVYIDAEYVEVRAQP